MTWRRFRTLVRGLSLFSAFANAWNSAPEEPQVLSPEEGERYLLATV